MQELNKEGSPQQAASMLFLKAGISGHRYLDRNSRSAKSGTYNFVIWDASKITMTGITPDSDELARNYYERTKKLKDSLIAVDAESYSQPQVSTQNLYIDDIPNDFITPETIERYDQLVYHGTGNIILGNKFDLRYVGSNQNSAILGYGAYFTQSKNAANTYRHFGQNSDITVLLKNGEKLSYLECLHHEESNGRISKGMTNVVAELNHRRKVYPNASGNALILQLKKETERRLADFWYDKKYSAVLQEQLDALNSIADITISHNGNVYIFDIPEDYELLNLDVDLHNQSEQIQNIFRKLMHNFDRVHMTGQQFYEWLSKKLGSDEKASMWLMKQGISGHYYLENGINFGAFENDFDACSYVIWDMSKIRMVSINPDSDQDAIDYYNHTKQLNTANEQYSQLNRPSSINNDLIGMNGMGQQQTISIPKQQLEAVRRKYQSTTQWMKAPNGEDTKLTERQWLQVRTPNFIRWFGDWENNPAEASKVLDENGEPLVVIHQTGNTSDFSIFNTTGRKGGLTEDTGAWFANLKGQSPIPYPLHKDDGSKIDGRHYYVFLNIRNPYVYDAGRRDWYDISRNKNDITTDDLVRAVKRNDVGSGNHDGVIIKNVDKEFLLYDNVDDYIVFNPEQIKSATANNGNFAPNDPDIYHQIIGEHGARRLDMLERSTTRIDALKLAEQMHKELETFGKRQAG